MVSSISKLLITAAVAQYAKSQLKQMQADVWKQVSALI